MKIRWTCGSIRLRITPTELARLDQGEIVREAVKLGSNEWTARVVPGGASTDYYLSDADLQVNLSVRDLGRLCDPELEGIYFTPSQPDYARLFIEKDLPCAHPRSVDAMEPQTETFTAPCKRAQSTG